jgi:all-trans-8'-apo-beta-carotenal 15,15'-oxygenase
MVTKASNVMPKSLWANAVTHTAEGFAPTRLPIVAGAIPPNLRGSLYRNGPARLERGGQRVGHWFDGDGAILGIHFTPSGATGVYRYVQTAGLQTEARSGQWQYGGYGMVAPGAFWQRFKAPKNAANTSVLALPDRLLALWEGGSPHALNLETLATMGLDDLGGLAPGRSYSAHPKVDAQTGDIYNFGIGFGKNAVLHVYHSDRTGQIRQTNAIALKGIPLVHDFVLAGPYLIFVIPPVRMEIFPMLARLKSFSETLTWRPEEGTQILVIDRDTLQLVSRGETDPWYQWHFVNGCVNDQGRVVVDMVRYSDFKTNQFLQEVATGITQTTALGTLWRMQVDPQSGHVYETVELCDRCCEFPVVKPHTVGQPWQDTYFSLHQLGVDPGQELFGAIGHFNYRTGTLTATQLGAQCYPMEPIYAPDPQNPNRGWILTVVYDGQHHHSQVWILDSDRLDDEPVCRLALPEVIPLGFHGTWKPA